MLTLILYVVVFMLLSGLMAAVDAAVLSVTRPEIEEMIHNRRSGAARLRAVKQEITRSVVVIVILTNTVNVLGPILVSREAFARYGPESLITVTIGLTLGTILFSEILPKAIGTHYAPLVGRLSATPLQTVGYTLYPLVAALSWLSRKCMRGTRPIGTERQIRALALIGRRAGHIESDEIRMIYRAFHLNDSTARDIMTPLQQVASIPSDTTIAEAAELARTREFSRYPVFHGSLDNVAGLVTIRDIFEAMITRRNSEAVSSITRRILTIDADQRSDELLMVFRDEHIHLGIVRDGQQTIGVVTLEDVLEELVGEIEDEKD